MVQAPGVRQAVIPLFNFSLISLSYSTLLPASSMGAAAILFPFCVREVFSFLSWLLSIVVLFLVRAAWFVILAWASISAK